MLASLSASGISPVRRAVPSWAVAVPLLLACALFMFVDARVPPIYLWDESRLAVNALEMHLRGWRLVTTYGFAPDLWNTKPPLAIWLMKASIDLFGPSEIAIRLPSMIAAMGTLAIVFAFVRRVTHKSAPAALSVFLLAASVAFFGEHGARTADFDALLCLFTTAYLSLLFFAVHRARPPQRLLIAIGALVAAAAMTKTIAGLVPGAGVAMYLLLNGRLGRALKTSAYMVMVAAALLPLGLFYLARELAVPGYLHAVWYNDFAGRYHDQLGPLRRPRLFFFQEIGADWMFSGGALLVLTPRGLSGPRGQSRQALIFALCCLGTQLLIISLPATRLIQYMLPAVPWMAIACGIAFADRIPRAFAAQRRTGGKFNLGWGLVAVTLLFSGVTAARLRYDVLPKRTFYPEASYGDLFATLHTRGVDRVSVVDDGLEVSGLHAYAPQQDFYALLWRTRGMTIGRAANLTAAGPNVVSCNPANVAAILAAGGESIGSDGCAAVLPLRPR